MTKCRALACRRCRHSRLDPGARIPACRHDRLRSAIDALRIAVLFGAVVFGWLRLHGLVGG